MTVRHVVMLRRHASVAADAAAEQELVSRLDALGGRITGLDHWRLAANEHDRPLCWDYLLDAEVADADALVAYLDHPLHRALLPDLSAYFELAVVDFDPRRSDG